jgi:hypothetical protein
MTLTKFFLLLAKDAAWFAVWFAIVLFFYCAL